MIVAAHDERIPVERAVALAEDAGFVVHRTGLGLTIVRPLDKATISLREDRNGLVDAAALRRIGLPA